jgi:hypothetical protein
MLKDGWMGSQAEMMRLIVIFTILQMCLKTITKALRLHTVILKCR